MAEGGLGPVPASQRSLLVRGLGPDVSEDLVELYFEKRKVGGGDVESIKMEGDGTALVVFKDSGVVENLLEYGNHKLSGNLLLISLPPVEEKMEEDEVEEQEVKDENDSATEESNAILVEGLTQSIDEEMLELFFENRKRSGGGEIEKIQRDQGSGQAIIWFIDPSIVPNVLQKGTLRFGGCELTVRPYVEEAMVKVSGINGKISEETLELFFENVKRSGGGDIKNIVMQLHNGFAIITYEDEMVADRVVQRQPFSLSGCQLTAERFHGLKPTGNEANGLNGEAVSELSIGAAAGPTVRDTPRTAPEVVPVQETRPIPQGMARSPGPFEEIPPVRRLEQQQAEVPPYPAGPGQKLLNSADEEMVSDDGSCDESELESCTIEVIGVSKKTSQDTVKKYFENRKKSSGGKTDDIWINRENGNYIITFTTRDPVPRVLKRNKHMLDNAKLQVKELRAASYQQPDIKEPLEPTKIYIHGLDDRISKDMLELTLEEITNGDVTDVEYALDPSVALVTFQQKIDYRNLQRVLTKKPIEGCMLGVNRVHRSRAVQVFKYGSLSSDSLAAYFESRKSGGSGEVNVKIHKDQECAIAEFESCEIADKVLSKKIHPYSGEQLEVTHYRERLGITPLNHDSSQPNVQIPNGVTIKKLDANKLYFLKNISEAKKHAEKEIMTKVHARVDWKHQSEDELRVECTLTKDNDDLRKLARSWEHRVQEAVTLLFESIQIEKRECLKKTWRDVCTEVRQMIKKGNQAVAAVEQERNSTLYIVGRAGMVKKVYQEVDKICKDIESRLDHIKDTMDLKEHEVAILKKTEIPRLQKKYPKVKITLRVSGASGASDVELDGIAKDLLSIQKELHTYLKDTQTKTIPMTKGKIKILSMLKRQQDSQFQKKAQKLDVVSRVEGNTVVICGKEVEINKYEGLLSQSIVERSIEVTMEEQTAFADTLWKEFSNAMFLKYKGILHLELQDDKTSVQLAAQQSDFHGALEGVKMHIQQNAIKESFIDLEYGQTRLIIQWMKEELAKVEKDFQRYGVKISSPDNYGILVTGTEQGLEPAKLRVENLSAKIITDSHTVTAPGMPHFFTQDSGKYFIKSQEERHRVIITYEDPDGDNAVENMGGRKKRPVAAPRGNKELHQAQVPGGTVIKVTIGDMTSSHLDAIVNAANSNLAHVGGLAKAILDKGGRTIRTESEKYVQMNGPVMEGHAVVTGPGKLPCKKIIHAVGPHWVDGRSGEEDVLYDCVFSHILRLAEEENLQSVAIPAISAGVFGFPVKKSADVIVEAIKQYLEDNKGAFSEIHLLDNRQEGGQAFVAALKKHFKTTQQVPFTLNKRSNQPGLQAQAAAAVGGNKSSYRTKEGIVITVKIGSIATEQVDLIFNTTSKDLNLHSGAISNAIVKAAGPGIQNEVTQQFPNGLKTGQHVISTGGNLSCQQIFHTVLCNWDGGQGTAEQVLGLLVKTSFDHANTSGYTSIALPAMGTGGLNFPRDVVAETMFSSVQEWSQSNPTSSVKDIRFVLYDKDKQTIDAFFGHLSTLTGFSGAAGSTGGPAASKRKVYKATSPAIEEPIIGAVGGAPSAWPSFWLEPGERSEPVRTRSFQGSPQGVQPGSGGEIQIGSILLQVVSGDIIQEKTDAIVNGTNHNLDITQGAVSVAIANAAGRQLVQECRRKGKVDQNGVAITSGGNLSASHVIHLDVQARGGKNDWKKGINACLQEAQKAGLSSLSFPALGTGMMNISADKMAIAMMESIAEFSNKNQTSSVSLVRVVIFQAEMIPTYLEQLDKATKPGSSILDMVTAPFRYMGNTIKELFSSSSSGVPIARRAAQQERGVIPIVPKSATKLDLTILGLKKQDIMEVKAEIAKICKSESEDLQIKGDEYTEAIKFLDQNQIIVLQNLGTQEGVRLTVDMGQRVARIRLQGQAKDVYKVQGMVQERLLKMKAELLEQQEAVMLAQFVQWEYKEKKNKFQPYPAEINTKLEKAHSNGEKTVRWKEVEDDGKITEWTIDLKSQTETNGRITKEVQRRVIGERGSTMEVPKNWTKPTGNAVYELVTLSNTHPEYKAVSQAFQKTCNRPIVQIERLQNKFLYRRYAVHKEDMEARNPPGTVNESLAWHGTAGASLNSINTHGFNRSYCGKHGVVHGQGVYFAVKAQYSTGYSQPDQNGQCQMYYARVLTGRYIQGNPSMKTPPSVGDTKNPSLHYDSTVDNPNGPSIYVIYYDTQAYPEYIVTFQ